MIKTLIAIDEPDLADVIVRMVCKVFDKTRLDVHLINVLETNLAENEYFLRNPEAFLKKKAQTTKILDLEDYFKIQNVQYKETHFKQGKAADEIIKLAKEEKFNLVVVGSHNKSKIDRFLLGSTSDNVMKQCPCSVFIVNPLHTLHEEETNILYGTDGSEYSTNAARKLAYFVNKEKTKVSIVNAWYYSDILVLKNLHEYLDIVGLAEALKEHSFNLVKTVVEIFHKNDVKTDKKISKNGQPAHVILDLLKKRTYDVVALGSHGKSNFEQIFLGSVSSIVYENSQISTLILKNES